MTTLTLVMIVKNESKIITRCLDSLKPYIDYIVISDTGSTDNTVDLIEEYLEKNKIKGKVYHDEWKNFGHNRSKSVTNGQDWLDKENIDKKKNYFITIDADMLLVFDNFDKSVLPLKDSWSLIQQNDTIKYHNLRLFRSDLAYKCIGVTHEYWGCDGNPTHGKLESIYINDIGDGGAKSDKFTRDIILLTKGIEDEPNNYRYYFYLAQSYSCISDHHNAIIWYNKRIEIGGWNEEIFISYLKLGELHMAIGEEEKAIYKWTMGFESLPERSETLYKICNYYRTKGKNHSSLLFLKKGISIPYPKHCSLFIEYHTYDYKFIEELSIIAYYVNRKNQGLVACQHLILDKKSSDYLRSSVLKNSFYYINKLLENKRTHKKLILPTESPYISSSACFVKDSKGFKGIVRSVNYSLDDKFVYSFRDDHNIVRTRNYWIEFNDGIEVFYEIKDTTNKVRESHIKGLEDMRICFIGEKLYGLAVDWEHCKNNHPSILLTHFSRDEDHKYVIDRAIPITYHDDICQKNWVLFNDNNKLYAVYSHHPLTILEIDPNTGDYKVIIEKYSNYNLKDIRGSAIPVYIPSETDLHPNGCWLFLIHEVMHRDTRKYFHRFLRYSHNWELLDISEPFYFNNFYVEFSLSIMFDKNQIMIPYSTRDNTTELITVDYNDIPWLPRDTKKWLIDNI
jgi:glycosyltransferase involved in cell wall biosynthesis